MRIYSILLPLKPWLVGYATILYEIDCMLFSSKLCLKWNKQNHIQVEEVNITK